MDTYDINDVNHIFENLENLKWPSPKRRRVRPRHDSIDDLIREDGVDAAVR